MWCHVRDRWIWRKALDAGVRVPVYFSVPWVSVPNFFFFEDPLIGVRMGAFTCLKEPQLVS